MECEKTRSLCRRTRRGRDEDEERREKDEGVGRGELEVNEEGMKHEVLISRCYAEW